MIVRRVLRSRALVTSLALLSAPAARAACSIEVVAPTITLPTPRADGERFVFWASADCAVLEFTSGWFSTTPVPGPRPGSGPRTYHVNLRPSVWNALVDGSDTTFEWTVRGWTTLGVVTEVTTTNELDFDHDGWTRSDGDDRTCDHDSARHPGATETCDGIDQDCNGQIDDITWFRDADRDGYGDGSHWLVASCDHVRGHVTVDGDCDDADATISPSASEICDDVDDDCDGFASCTFSLSDADAEYTGEGNGDGAGWSVAGAGDIDGDGYHDILVGAPYNDDGRVDAGAAYVVLGGPSPASASLSAAGAKYAGEAAGDYAGRSVAGVGDVDGDGYGDILVGAYGSGGGAAYVLLGSPSPAAASLSAADAAYTGEATDDRAGWSVAGAGDVDDDGYYDMLVGALDNDDGGVDAGAAYIMLGGPSPGSASLSTAHAEYTGKTEGDLAGVSVAGAGDVDGDGYADVLVGAIYNSDGGAYAGAAYLVLGGASPRSASLSTADAEYTGEAGGDYAGGTVAGAGDVDADGYGDVVVGASFNNALAGAAYLLLGGPSPASASLAAADAEYIGETEWDFAGVSVAGAGDANGDGFGDVLVGASGNTDGGGDYAGAAYLVLGDPSPASASLAAADAEYTGEASYDVAAWVAGAGDVDGDGYDDVLVGAKANDGGGEDAGAAYLLLGGGL